MKNNSIIHIGTSGWQYDHWQGPFYPEQLPKQSFLAHYGQQFQTVEINNTFYQLPAAKTLANWQALVPDDFVFAVKASRYITHMKKLKDPQKAIANFFERIPALGHKLGPILFQLPPNWKFNAGRLQDFLAALPRQHRYAFELRAPGWLNDHAYQLLADYNVALCIYDFDGRLSPKKVTADFVYIRLHGPEAKYQGKYNPETLSGWADAISSWMS